MRYEKYESPSLVSSHSLFHQFATSLRLEQQQLVENEDNFELESQILE